MPERQRPQSRRPRITASDLHRTRLHHPVRGDDTGSTGRPSADTSTSLGRRCSPGSRLVTTQEHRGGRAGRLPARAGSVVNRCGGWLERRAVFGGVRRRSVPPGPGDNMSRHGAIGVATGARFPAGLACGGVAGQKRRDECHSQRASGTGSGRAGAERVLERLAGSLEREPPRRGGVHPGGPSKRR